MISFPLFVSEFFQNFLSFFLFFKTVIETFALKSFFYDYSALSSKIKAIFLKKCRNSQQNYELIRN